MSSIGEGMNESLALDCSFYKQAFLLKIAKPANIDLYNCRDISTLFDEKNSEKVTNWILDLSLVKYIDSSGIGILIRQAGIIQPKGFKIFILNPKPSTSHIFSMAGFSKWFSIETNLEEIKV